MIDLATLFEPQLPVVRRFENVQQELEIVKARQKGMSIFTFSRAEIDSDRPKELARMALDLGLSLIHHYDHIAFEELAYDQITCFVLYPEEAWRVPAYLLVYKAFQGRNWSNGAEHLVSSLLGYSEEEISSWIGRKKSTRMNWTGLTFYLLMSKQQQILIERLGMRCIDPQSMLEPIMAFFSRSKAVMLKAACDKIPDNMVIGRVSVRSKMFLKIFDNIVREDPDVISRTIDAEMAISLNAALDSNFQFLHPAGWQ